MINIVFITTHPLQEPIRIKSVSSMYNLIASYLDLKGYIKEAHWNSKGVAFIAIHRLFDEIGELFDELIDDLGERVRTLGAQAYANTSYVAANSKISTLIITFNIDDNVSIITENLKIVSAMLLTAISQLDSGDKVTSNLLQDQAGRLDRFIYLLEGNLCMCGHMEEELEEPGEDPKEEALETPAQEAVEEAVEDAIETLGTIIA